MSPGCPSHSSAYEHTSYHFTPFASYVRVADSLYFIAWLCCFTHSSLLLINAPVFPNPSLFVLFFHLQWLFLSDPHLMALSPCAPFLCSTYRVATRAVNPSVSSCVHCIWSGWANVVSCATQVSAAVSLCCIVCVLLGLQPPYVVSSCVFFCG